MTPASRRSTLTLLEATVVSSVCFGLFILASLQAVMAGFPDAHYSETGNAWSIGVEAVLAVAALGYLRVRGFDIASLYPRPTLAGSVSGLGLFLLAWVIGALAMLPFIAPDAEQVVGFSFAGVSLLSTVLFAMVNGAFEEVFLLGVLMRGLRGYGLSLAIGVPLLVRVLYHLYQGPLGVVWILAFGLTFSLAYLRRQDLWPPVLAHVLWDIVPAVLAPG